jgi:hypothetical protein
MIDFGWTNFIEQRTYTVYDFPARVVSLPSVAINIGWMVLNTVVFLILAIYFDKVFAGMITAKLRLKMPGTSGESKSWLFPLEWLFKACKASNVDEERMPLMDATSQWSADVQREFESIAKEGSGPAFQLRGLCKTFNPASKGCLKKSKSTPLVAVNNLWLSSQPGQILAILG